METESSYSLSDLPFIVNISLPVVRLVFSVILLSFENGCWCFRLNLTRLYNNFNSVIYARSFSPKWKDVGAVCVRLFSSGFVAQNLSRILKVSTNCWIVWLQFNIHFYIDANHSTFHPNFEKRKKMWKIITVLQKLVCEPFSSECQRMTKSVW